MKNKKEEQAKRWREWRKTQGILGKTCERNANAFDISKEETYEKALSDFAPLTEEEQRKVLFLLHEFVTRCQKLLVDDYKAISHHSKSGKENDLFLSALMSSERSLGRKSVYELLETLFRGNNQDCKRYKERLLSTADEWLEKKKDEKED